MEHRDNMAEPLTFRDKHSFSLFIVISILIASLVVVISMAMYNSSGAAQLDLSRPGYTSVRAKVVTDGVDFKEYPSSGKITREVIDDFNLLYKQHAQKVQTVDAFGGDPLSSDALGISAPAEQ